MRWNDMKNLTICALLCLPVIAYAESLSTENNKPLSQGIAENPVMGFVTPVFENLRIHELNSVPETGALRISYNNDEKERLTGVSVQRIPDEMDKQKAQAALAEGIELTVAGEDGVTPEKWSFSTAKGVDVNCFGKMMSKEKKSNSICYSVFDNYYIQANMVWDIADDEAQKAGRDDAADRFVEAVIDRFSEFPGI